jgi:hypothetical protein
MLIVNGAAPDSSFCDGLSRRSFLRIGGLALGGLSLPQILAAQQTSPRPARSGGLGHKAVIMVYLPGGPPHQDMYDLKMDASSEVRGPFRPMKTNVEGIQICELMPRLAGVMDKLVPIRSLVDSATLHQSIQCTTGRLPQNPPIGGWPDLGAVVARLQGGTQTTIPPFMCLAPNLVNHGYDIGTPGFLGSAFAPFKPEDEGKRDLTLNGITVERLQDRKQLLASLDQFRRNADNQRVMDGVDAFTQQAFSMLTSSKLATALDLSKEDPRIRERYGTGTATHQGDGAPRLNQQFLLARRLVEAGVRCVSFSYSNWDWHQLNFENARKNLPDFDQAMSALVVDLHDRGLDQDVTVIAWGEFGRSPLINKDAGRDHWPRVTGALLAGGGMRTGQVIGSTSRDGGEVTDRPVYFQEVFATLYHNLGIDVGTAQVTDLGGRPHYLLDLDVKPLRELI